jgi:hypothetical protein
VLAHKLRPAEISGELDIQNGEQRPPWRRLLARGRLARGGDCPCRAGDKSQAERE